jgi:hypothetical protein
MEGKQNLRPGTPLRISPAAARAAAPAASGAGK